MSARRLFERTAAYAADFVESLGSRSVEATASVDELRAALGGPLPAGPADPDRVVLELAKEAEPGLVGMAGGRYFGFVIGGGVPAAVAADWLTSVWVLVRIRDGSTTDEVMRRVRESGVAWMSGTQWGGESAMRLSVSNWQTTAEDVERTAATILAAARAVAPAA